MSDNFDRRFQELTEVAFDNNQKDYDAIAVRVKEASEEDIAKLLKHLYSLGWRDAVIESVRTACTHKCEENKYCDEDDCDLYHEIWGEVMYQEYEYQGFSLTPIINMPPRWRRRSKEYKGSIFYLENENSSIMDFMKGKDES